jgi:hypothetical protein
VSAHADGEELDERRTLSRPRPRGGFANDPEHLQHVVPVTRRAGHAIAGCAVDQTCARVLLARRRGQTVLVVLDDEENR